MRRTTGLMAALILGALMALPVAPRAQSKADVALRAAIETETVKGDLKAAIEQYKAIAAGADRATAAKALVRLGECYQKQGNAESSKVWERVVSEFADQKDAAADAQRLLGSGARPLGGAVVERLVSFPDRRDLRKISRDGRFVIYRAADGLYVHDLVTHADRRVVAKASPDERIAARFVPDGTQVLYDTCPGDFVGCEVYVVKIDGSGRRLLHRGDRLYSMAITPDGARLAFGVNPARDGYNEDIYVENTDAPAPRLVLTSQKDEWYEDAEWSPDGKSLLIGLGDINDHYRLVLVSMPDATAKVVADNAGSGSFSPDGRHIVFERYKDPASRWPEGIYVAQADGERETRLAATRGNSSPMWTTDGKRVLFRSRRPDQVDPRIAAQVSEGRFAPADLYAVRVADGLPAGTPEVIAKDLSEPGMMLGQAQDGSVYYSTSNRSDIRDMYQVDLDPQTGKIMSAAVRLNQRFVGSTIGPPRWSPDGQLLAFARVMNQQRTLAIRSTATGEERELVPFPPFDSPANGDPMGWFPDSVRLLVGDITSGHRVLRIVDVRTGKTELLLDRGPVGTQFPAVALSEDGKALFYAASQSASGQSGVTPTVRVMRREVESGAETELWRTESPATRGLALPSPDGASVVISLAGLDGKAALWIVPTAGGTARVVYRSKGAWAQAWTRDGRHLLVVEPESAAGAAPGVAPTKHRLFSVAVDGSGAVPAGLEMPFLGGASVHPDGHRLAIIGGETKNTELWVMRVKPSGATSQR